jgi:hypothetical protein
LRQVNQILRDTLFAQHARNHLAVAARAVQPGFHDGAAPRRLKEIEEGKDFVVHRQGQVMRAVFGRFFGPAFQARVHRKRHLRDFIDRRRNRRRLAESVAGA